MIFLFEQYSYSLDYLKKVLPTDSVGRFKGLPNDFVGRDCKLDGVGYFYNKSAKKSVDNAANNIVFVLPKVFMDEAKRAFGKEVKSDEEFALGDAPKDFLASLSMWVCSSIAQYRKAHPSDKNIEAPDAQKFGSDKQAPTLIDVVNAMKLFYAENRNLFVFTAKNKHCGNNRIDWRRTVARTQPFMQGDTPIYMELENKKKVFDLDDRLLVLFFSAMNYIEETFGFKMPKSEFYAPIRVNEFRRLLGHRGLVELRRIKHKYFADRFLKLYNIVKAFFEWGANFSANDFESEYLLTSKYNNVFEAMIDKLVGDELPERMMYLKSQKDDKEVDHLYKDRQLIFADEEQKIWFIGDSKYYKDGNDIAGTSLHKQFTYARNIIQYNINDLLVKGSDKSLMRYRDELTEGYSVTPNFFIRGTIPEFNSKKANVQYNDPYFRESPNSKIPIKVAKRLREKLWKNRNRHFANRLFDRDTLLLQVYNVNFLYVLKAYTSKRSNLREEFKKKARGMFRKNFLQLLNEKYVFYGMWPKDNLAQREKTAEQAFVDSHFRILVGKIFKPADFGCLILALEKDSVGNENQVANKEVVDLWHKIVPDCKMIYRIPVTEIWNDDMKNLPEADFGQAYYDENLHGFFVERELFENAKIGEMHKLPKFITNRPITGDVQLGLPQESSNWDRDDYYFLPCE